MNQVHVPDIRQSIPGGLIAFSDRLNWLVRHMPDEIDYVLANGMSKSLLARLRKGNSTLSVAQALLLANACGVSLNWLLGGQGDPIFDWDDASPIPTIKTCSNSSTS
jgi:hypothetical protein